MDGRVEARLARHATDLLTLAEARRLDAAAEAVLVEAVGAEAVASAVQYRSRRWGSGTPWPRRRALHRLAATSCPKAAVLYAQADGIYWTFAVRHRGLVTKLANIHARLSGAPVEVIHAVIVEASFRAAVAWDPTRARYATALGWYARAGWQLADERQDVVMLCAHDRKTIAGGFGHAAVDSLNAPVHHEEEGVTFLDVLVDDDARDPVDAVTSARLRAAVADLPDRERRVILARLADENGTDTAAAYGITRQRVQQIKKDAIRRLHVALTGIAPPPASIAEVRREQRVRVDDAVSGS